MPRSKRISSVLATSRSNSDPTPNSKSDPSSGEKFSLQAQSEFENKYRIIGLIGKGGFSEVYKAQLREFDPEIHKEEYVAVKILHANKEIFLKIVHNEISFLRRCQSDNIV